MTVLARPPTAIRAGTVEDLPAVAGIYAHYVSESVVTFETVPPGVADWAQRLAAAEAAAWPFLVATEARDVVGYAYASPWRGRPGYRLTIECSVYVEECRLGQGIGRALLTELLVRADAAGAREVVAVIADTSGTADRADGVGAASIALHRSLGFRDVGRLHGVGHKHGQWLDTALMQRSLGPASPAAWGPQGS
jgi:L-amino acid N-acyltransferase YncA